MTKDCRRKGLTLQRTMKNQALQGRERGATAVLVRKITLKVMTAVEDLPENTWEHFSDAGADAGL